MKRPLLHGIWRIGAFRFCSAVAAAWTYLVKYLQPTHYLIKIYCIHLSAKKVNPNIMKRIYFTFILACLCLISFAAEQSALVISPSKLKAGKSYEITYTGSLAKEGTVILAIIYYPKTEYTKQLVSQLDNKTIQSSFTVPDSALYVNFIYKNGEVIDHNFDIGYGYYVYKNGKPIKGAYAKEARFIMNSYFLGFPDDGDKALALLDKEYKLHPDLKKESYSLYLMALQNSRTRSNEILPLANKVFNETLQNGGTDKYMSVYISFIARGNAQIKDSLDCLVRAKFPSGNLAHRYLRDKMDNEKDPDKRLVLISQLQEQFPSYQYPEFIQSERAKAYGEKYDFSKFDSLMIGLKDTRTISFTYNELALNLANKNMYLDMAKQYSAESIQIIDAQRKQPIDEFVGTQKDWENIMDNENSNFYATSSIIAEKMRDTLSSINFQSKCVALSVEKNPTNNERLIRLLLMNKQYDDVMTAAKKIMIAKNSTAVIDSLYDVANKFKNGNDSIQNAEKLAIEKQLNIAPDFTLKTLDGKLVTLTSLKGKIVVLDFWATWCSPCLASFEGMQQVLNTFKNDTSVCFLFVNTGERTDKPTTLKNVKQLIARKKVNFTFLFDEWVDGSYLVNKLYDISGIPCQIIIDKNGMIYCRKKGYNSNVEEVISEYKKIISALK